MTEIKFHSQQRLMDFRQNFRAAQLRSKSFLLYGGGWLLTFFVLITSLSRSAAPLWIAIGIHFYFWFKSLDEIRAKVRPLPEFALVLYFLLFYLEYLLLRAVNPPADAALRETWAFTDFFQALLLAPLFLSFSILLIQNEKGKKGGVVFLFFLGFIFHSLPTGGSDLLFWLFQLFLLVSLLKHTTWLEELSQVECWIYFLAVLFLLNVFAGLNPFADFRSLPAERSWLWSSIPHYLFLLFKLYLLALLVRIPLVLIYNYATLSRKLRISGFFQSTFPQLIQLIALVVIFYFFISAWQAKNLQETFVTHLDQIATNSPPRNIPVNTFIFKGEIAPINLARHEPLEDWRSFPRTCVVEMERQDGISANDTLRGDYYLFSWHRINDSTVVRLIEIDSTSIKALSGNLQFLAGNSIEAYPFKPDRWGSYFYELNFWQADPNIHIFPFSFLPYDAASPVFADLENGQEKEAGDDSLNIQVGGMNIKRFAVGRVFLPFRANPPAEEVYFAFDIILNLQSWSFWKGLGPILLVMMAVYFLLNAFVIRQMVKFGSQINKLIVQKFRQLQSGIQQISSGNLDYKIRFEGEDEFTELGERFNEMGDRLKQTIAETREKERLQFELQSAREVQLSLLPRELPDIPGYRVAASLHTATEVGGDFYDMFALPPGNSGQPTRFLVTIGDVSGKGSSAAFYMAQCMSLIRFSRQFTANPAEICTRLNEYFTATLTDRQIFVTAIVGILDITGNEFKFVRAGHTHPLFIPREAGQKIRYLETKGLGIGLTNKNKLFDKTLKPFRIPLKPGDTIVLYTDGVVEASRPGDAATYAKERELYDESRLENLLGKYRGREAEYIRRELELDLQAFYGGHPRVDDHTVVILQRGNLSKQD